jgi:hypothetical protein
LYRAFCPKFPPEPSQVKIAIIVTIEKFGAYVFNLQTDQKAFVFITIAV